MLMLACWRGVWYHLRREQRCGNQKDTGTYPAAVLLKMIRSREVKMKRANIIFGVCAVLWMVVIFCFSAADGNESSKTSGWVGRMIGHIFVSGFDDMTETEQEEWASKIEYPIRKAAHATEYAVLALLAFGTFPLTGFKRYGAAWIFAVFYAGTDEFHQLFVPGRAGTLFDVGVDSLGALTGLLLLAGIRALIHRRSKKREEVREGV